MTLLRRFAVSIALAISVAALAPSAILASTVEVYPGPGVDTYKSNLYQVDVSDGTNWIPAYVYKFSRSSRCHWHFGANPSVNFMTFGTDGPVDVRVTKRNGPISHVDASPHSKPRPGSVTGGQAIGTLQPNDKLWLTIDGDDANPLYIFVDGLKPSIPAGATYFGPGVHDIAPAAGNHYKASTGEAIYLDGGAWERGNIDVSGTHNVRVMGPGVLSGDLWTWESVKDLPFDQYTKYAMITGDFYGGNGADVRGITIVDTPAYPFFSGASDVTGIKVLTPWVPGTDGLPGVAHVAHIFSFTGDEALMPIWAGAQGDDVTITSSFAGTTNNTVLAGGYWGYEARKGYTALVDDMDLKTYDNDDWVTGPNPAPLMGAAIQVWMDNSDSSKGYANQTYQNIRVEGNLKTPLLELQNRLYPFATAGSAGAPIPPLGNSYNFIIRNISLEGTSKYRSPIQGQDANDGFHNVVLDNVTIGGTPVTPANLSQFFDVNAYVWGLAVTADPDYLASVLPVVGSAPGSHDSYFKTSMQAYNPGTTTYTLRVVFHPAGRSAAAGDPSKTLTVPAGSMLYYPDLLPAIGVATGLGSLDVYLPTGETRKLTTTFRVYNDGGAAGTSGFNEDLVPFNKIFVSGATVLLTCPPDPAKARLNVGVRTLGDGATITATLRNAVGATVKTVVKNYAANYFEQVTLDGFLGGATVVGNESLTLQITAGQAVVYGATVDNTTNDSSASLAVRQ
jgi:hypothetical protein